MMHSHPACGQRPSAVRRRRCMLAAALLWCAWPCSAADDPHSAAAAAARDDATVLTISGPARKAGESVSTTFDMAALSRFEQHSVVTHTPWYPQAHRFTGPLLRDVLAAAGARGTTLRAIALNDYHVELPYSDVLDYDVVLARLIDGKPIAVRDKGPLFIIYPFDAHTDLRNAVYYSRSAWQLERIEVR